MALAVKIPEPDTEVEEKTEKKIEYSSIIDGIRSLITTAYHLWDRVGEKHYSYDPSVNKIVPYSRNLPLGIHLKGVVERIDPPQTKNVQGLEFISGNVLKLSIDLTTEDEVVSQEFEIPIYEMNIEGWKHKKQAWAIAINTIKKYKLDSLTDYIVFPHGYKTRRTKENIAKMLLILLDKKDLQKIEEWFRENVKKLVPTAVPTPASATPITTSGEISDEELKKRIEEALEEKTVLEVSLPSPAPQAQQVTAVASQAQAPTVSEDFEKLRREVEELREIIEKRFDEWARRQGLEKVRLIVFKIPTEYMGSKTVYEETPEGIVEKKILKIDPSKARSLRKKFYDVLHRNAYKIYDMWALRSDADLDEINKVAEEINRTFGVERSVTIVDTYMPRNYVVNALKEYINERKMRYKEVEDKLTKIETAREKRELMRELEELEREINTLEQELKKLEKTEITIRL
jgi:hypothetical protein